MVRYHLAGNRGASGIKIDTESKTKQVVSLFSRERDIDLFLIVA